MPKYQAYSKALHRFCCRNFPSIDICTDFDRYVSWVFVCIDWCVRYFYVGFHNVFTPFIGLLKIEIKQFLMSENFQFIHLNNITRSQKWWQFRIYYFGLLPCPAPLGRGAPHPCLIIVVDKVPCQHQGSPKKSVFQTQTVIYQKVS